ncbi:MAG: DUF3316 domain-containing protein [Alloprevotella sp.]|nr:DUF3316 domain-containing protein [Alloprevotella sp.]
MFRILKYLSVGILLLLPAQTGRAQTEHRWLFGLVGSENILDTYLSPLSYTGMAHGTLHRSERPSRLGDGRWDVVFQSVTNFSYTSSPTDDGHYFDGQGTLGGGLVRVWMPSEHWRMTAGALLQGTGGITYSTRNGNNPVQGRLGAELAPTATCEYDFHIGRMPLKARAQLDVPLVGAMFTPRYGQSYYELFSLGHYDRNVVLSHPFNAPSARLLTTLDFRIRHTVLTVGYEADIRQSHVAGLKRHAWSHTLVVGFVRRMKRIKD